MELSGGKLEGALDYFWLVSLVDGFNFIPSGQEGGVKGLIFYCLQKVGGYVSS